MNGEATPSSYPAMSVPDSNQVTTMLGRQNGLPAVQNRARTRDFPHHYWPSLNHLTTASALPALTYGKESIRINHKQVVFFCFFFSEKNFLFNALRSYPK